MGAIGLVGMVTLVAALGAGWSPGAAPIGVGLGGVSDRASVVATPSATPSEAAASSGAERASRAAPSRIPATVPTQGTTNVYAGAGLGMFSPTVASFPPRVYVPDEQHGTVVVIDPTTYKILFRYKVGASPEHVTPDWDLKRLYVEASFGNRLTVIDPTTGRPSGHHSIAGPYNLYFTLDGRMAIVVLDSNLAGGEYGPKQLFFYDRHTWRLIKALRIPWAGADHLDFSADGSYVLLSTEYSGRVVKVDVKRMKIAGVLIVGGKPIDVRLSPDGRFFYVANQGTNGVSIVDPITMRQVRFLKTGNGAHGEAISRDARFLYVTNRRAGTLSVIDFGRRKVVHTWRIGGSPDMIAVSPDGTRLWISNRYGGTVSVIDSRTGHIVRIIHVGGRPHGLAYFPEPGSHSLGHNGIYR